MRYSCYWVYILSNRSGGLYVGMTNNLGRRISQHKGGEIPGFSRKYRMNRLIHCEEFSSVREAIEREKQIKRWRREKKVNLINQHNPGWVDLTESEPDER